MAHWTGIVAALGPRVDDGMTSRLPTHLHPVAGRPLVWHAVAALVAAEPAPARVLVLGSAELPEGLFDDLGADVDVVERPGDATGIPDLHLGPDAGRLVLASAAAIAGPEAITSLVAAPAGAFLGGSGEEIVALRLPGEGVEPALADSIAGISPLPGPRLDLPGTLVVRDRASLAAAGRAIRDRLVAQLMAAGVTFLLPDSVIMDVDVRIGRDSVVYPGVILEGQTTIGEETVIGPGCRIISSWIGSGVELKGWNYIAHTSVRNRAILEPYVRRGFD